MIGGPWIRRSLAAALLVLGLGPAAPAQAALTCGDLRELSSLLLQKHIRVHMMTPEVRKRAVATYIERLDPQRLLYLEAEQQRLSQRLEDAFLEVRAGECAKLRAIHEDAASRTREQEAFVRRFLGADGYRVDTTAEIVLDPEKRGWPKTTEQRDEWLRALVHFQVSNFLASGEALPEARQRIVHRYELRTKRMTELDREDLYAGFLDALANALDPHSSYLTQDALDDFQIQMELSLEGIGVALSERDGYAVVEQIIPGGAADRISALQPQDRIVGVAEDGKDAVDIIDMPLRDVVRLIRGKKGSRVHLTVVREGEKAERFQVAILRDKINLEEQAAKLRFETLEVGQKKLKLAVLELPSFYGDGDGDPSKRQGSRDVKRLLEEAKREKAQGVLLDLSRNGGGLLDDAVRISGFFVRQGGIVAVQSSEDRTRVLEDPDGDLVWQGPLVVLTSRVSASASEILAGAMKDYRRAVVVGDAHTFGKGTVQSLIPLRTGLGALKITTGLFFRPGGASTQHAGVAADVTLPSLLTEDLVGERTQPHSLQVAGIDAFVSPQANGNGTSERWKPVNAPLVSELARRSQARVAGNEMFLEIEEQVAKRQADDGVVRLSELLAEQEQEKAKNGDATTASTAPETKPAADAPTPHIDEALKVLADLVLLNS
jgi:carboxyl-terminal processing protease